MRIPGSFPAETTPFAAHFAPHKDVTSGKAVEVAGNEKTVDW